MKPSTLLLGFVIVSCAAYGQSDSGADHIGAYGVKMAVAPLGENFDRGATVGLNRNIPITGRYFLAVGVDYSRYEVAAPQLPEPDPATPFLRDFGMLEVPVFLSVDIIQKPHAMWRVFPQVGYSLGMSNHERRVQSTKFVTDPFYHFVVSRVMANLKISDNYSLSFGPHVKAGKLYRGVQHKEVGLSLELQLW